MVRYDDDTFDDTIGEWRGGLCRAKHKAVDTSHAENDESLLLKFRSCISCPDYLYLGQMFGNTMATKNQIASTI